MSVILCPYCFEEFGSAEVHWRCENTQCVSPSDGAPGEFDDEYRSYLTEMNPGRQVDPQRRGHHFELSPEVAAKRKEKNAFCNWCGKKSVLRICPKCHNALPHTIDEMDNYIVAVVGAAGVGKSHFIATLLDQIKNAVGYSFEMSLMALTDETTGRYKKEFYNRLFVERRVLDKSQAIDRSPLMYRLKRTKRVGPLKLHKSAMLVFFDNAGETFNTATEYGVFARYVRHASAVIFLADPLQMPGIRERLVQSGVTPPPSSAEPADILSRTINQFEAFGMKRANGRISVPIAVAFTKVDVLKDAGILPAGNATYSAARHVGSFDDAASRLIHDEVASMLVQWEGSEFDMLLQHNFSHYRYCAISALGLAPTADGKIVGVSPFRAEDPFLWALNELKFI